MSFNTRRVRRSRSQWVLIVAVSAIVGTALGVVALAATAYGAAETLTADLPDLDGPLPSVEQTTKILASDGTLLTKLFYDEDRVPITLSKVPQDLIDAVVASEDKRFFAHRGVDAESIARAAYADLQQGSIVEGGSTITQQLIKNTYGEKEQTFRRKLREALMAYQLEERYPKEKILERYLNTIYLGHSVYGVEAASRMYFGKPASQVTLAEAALLAGIIRSPNNNSPYVSKSNATKRRNRVLDQMTEQGYITTAQAGKTKKSPVRVVPPRRPKGKAPYFVEYVKQLLIDRYGADRVFKGGLTVTTTIDMDMQKAAEEAAWGALDQPGDPAAALVAIETTTGAIKAMVGGKHFERLNYNLATQGHRQPGSAFKPFVLATALSQGYSLQTRVNGTPGTLELPGGGTWKVQNSTGGGSGGIISVHDATVHSVNAAFARLILDLGADDVADTAERMGIKTQLNRDPAIALGGLKRGVTPLEMASAYGTLATEGLAVDPTPIKEIRGSSGRVMAKLTPTGEPVLDQAVCALEIDALEDVIKRGTGTRAQIGRTVAGKTGTTQNYHDAWFVGFTPDLVAAVWVGHPERQKPMYSVHGRRVFGGTFPAMIWADFMREALKDTPDKPFPDVPKDRIVKVRICRDTDLVATQYCPNTGIASYLSGQEPEEPCNEHTTPDALTVPRVVGRQVGEASTLLASKGLVPVSTYVRSNEEAGTVLAQAPDAGNMIEYGGMVSMRVSAGPEGEDVDRPPRAAITLSTHSPQVGKPITFDGSASTDAEGPIGKWSWDFGDGKTALGARVSHKYETVGRFSVTLTVYDSEGQVNSLETQVTVQP